MDDFTNYLYSDFPADQELIQKNIEEIKRLWELKMREKSVKDEKGNKTSA